ncbi:MAG: pyrimidine dimer DNA glycosylase/endonuclease V [Infirmifilum uzonense]|uniref:pyrimidine dimer DNA glycosylase/endonuclease V n=1 Tax=Infirmifilum TaxID=2856573 RepID=UPI003C75C2B7
MRLWSIHPRYLDRYGLLGLWREALLAQKVLEGLTKGYTSHPQLERFRATSDPVLYIGTYLYHVYDEGVKRGYSFNKDKIIRYDLSLRLPVTEGQIIFEFNHLLRKLKERDPSRYEAIRRINRIETHPLFYVVPGDIEPWEKTTRISAMRKKRESPS